MIRLGDEAFAGCYSLTKVEFLGLPEELGEGLFTFDSALETVVLPQGLTEIQTICSSTAPA